MPEFRKVRRQLSALGIVVMTRMECTLVTGVGWEALGRVPLLSVDSLSGHVDD